MKRVTVLLFALLFFVSLTAWAQEATITGTVEDSTGAVIPGAKVTVSNSAKGYTRDFTSNAAGEYAAVKIPIGDYVVTAEAPGFQKLVRSGITVTVGQTLRVDLQLQVGQVTQEVTVSGSIVRVETETAAISDVVTGRQIQNLELNGRNWVTLATLVPGAAPDNGLDTSHVGVYGNNSISFNGGRTQYNNWEIDGGPNTDEGSAGTFNTYPSLDTVAEFRISTSNYGADMGKHAGATIELVTKSGTRDFHGTVFEYVRNEKFDANDWFVNQTVAPEGGNAPKTSLKWNDYGYNIGGPFYIPGHYNTDKTKTFFFWSQNWRKYREGQVIGPHFTPSLRMRQGDFSECDPTSPNANATIIDQGCTLPTLNSVTYTNVNQMPGFNASDFASAQALLDGLIPLPNSGVDTFVKASSTSTNWRQEQIRVDQNIGDKTRLFVRYTQDAWDTLAVPALWTGANFDTIKTPFGGPGKSAVLNITHSFKPNLMNEFVMGYTVDHILLDNQVGASSVAGSINKPSGWTVKNFFPANAGNPLLPSLDVDGGLPDSFDEDAGNHPRFNSNPIITWKDNVAWTHGKHTTKFGFFLEKYRKNEQFGANTQGFISFATGSLSTQNALADMFLGRIDNYNEGTLTVAGVPVGGYPKGYWRMTALEPYIQDDWKVTSKLTLNLGLRYYLFTRIHDVGKPTVDSGFIPSLYNPAFEATLNADGNLVKDPATGHVQDWTSYGNGLVECGTGAILKGCQKPYYWTLAPRFGFALDPWGNGKTVIRGGYGIYYEMGNGNEAQTEGGEGNPPVSLGPTGYNILGYDAIQPIFNNGAYSVPIPTTGYTSIPYEQKWGSVQQFSFGVQHEFPGNNVLGVSWVGSLGRHLARNRNINQVPVGATTMNVPALAGENNCPAGNCDVQQVLIFHDPTSNVDFFRPYQGYNTIGQKENTAISNYNSLQVSFRHVVGHGLTLQAAYTWSHSLDDSTSTYSSSPNSVNDYNLSRWYATSDGNRTQVLQFNYVYDLPFFKNSTNAVAKGVLGGWTISGINSFFTGQPINFRCGVSGFSSGVGGSVMCNTVGKVQIQKGTVNDSEFGPVPTWYDPSVTVQPNLDQLFANNQPGMFGYMGRNVLTGPGRNNWDMALLKDIQLPWFKGEHSTVQFRLETFNTWNHPQWNSVNSGCSDSLTFGDACNTGRRGQINGAWAPRIMQLGLKFLF